MHKFGQISSEVGQVLDIVGNKDWLLFFLTVSDFVGQFGYASSESQYALG